MASRGRPLAQPAHTTTRCTSRASPTPLLVRFAQRFGRRLTGLAGKHEPRSNDVAVVILLRHQLTVVAVSCASDLRLLECLCLHPGFGSAISVRDTFHEGVSSDACPGRTQALQAMTWTVLCVVRRPRTPCCCLAGICAAAPRAWIGWTRWFGGGCSLLAHTQRAQCPICRAPVDSYVVFGEVGQQVDV